LRERGGLEEGRCGGSIEWLALAWMKGVEGVLALGRVGSRGSMREAHLVHHERAGLFGNKRREGRARGVRAWC
jgi:hypothetical protein